MISSTDNTQRIYNLLNKLQKSMLKSIKFQELQCDEKFLAYQLYQCHIDYLVSLNEKDVIYQLSLDLFKLLFEGEENFLPYTEEKADVIKILIEINEKKEIGDKLFKLIYSKILSSHGEDFHNDVKELSKLLEKIKITPKMICALLLYFIIDGDFSLDLILTPLMKILKDRFPYSDFCFDTIGSDITLEEFVCEFSDIAETLDNYIELNWEPNDGGFILTKKNIEIVVNTINTNEENCAKKKRRKKKKKNKNKIKDENVSNPRNNSTKENSSEIKDEHKVRNNIDIKDEKIIMNNNKESFTLINVENKETKNLDDNKKANKPQETKKECEKKTEDKKDELCLYKEECERLKEQLIDVKNTLLDKIKQIKRLEFYMKMIGLRISYKSFIDVFIFTLKLEEKGNLDKKIKTLENYLKNNNNDKKSSIMNIIIEMNYLLKNSNFKAHYINFKENIIQQMLNILNIYISEKNRDNVEYDERFKYLLEIFEKFNIKDKFENLVKIRTEKYRLSYSIFTQKEKEIIDDIKNSSYEEGLKYLNN